MPGWRKDAQAVRELAMALAYKEDHPATYVRPAEPTHSPQNEEWHQKERQRLARQKMAALAYVNQIRDEMRLGSVDELTPGIKSVGNACVIAESVKRGAHFVDGSAGYAFSVFSRRRWVFRRYDVKRENPADVSEFIADFDRGMYPELARKRYPY